MLKRKIGWQKYEDVIEDQINSPIMDMITKSIENNKTLEPFLNSPDMPPSYEEEDEEDIAQKVIVSVPEEITNEIHLMSNFDCWMGHVNFNLTDEIKGKLSQQDGVEILKVCRGIGFLWELEECLTLEMLDRASRKHF